MALRRLFRAVNATVTVEQVLQGGGNVLDFGAEMEEVICRGQPLRVAWRNSISALRYSPAAVQMRFGDLFNGVTRNTRILSPRHDLTQSGAGWSRQPSTNRTNPWSR